MKKFISVIMIAAILGTSTGCFGEFALTRKLWAWNDDVTDSRFVNNLVFYALAILPVYEVVGAADLIIFNLIEFWTGDNPLAMQEGERDRQIIPLDGEEYIVEASKNQFELIAPDGERTILRFEESDASWNLISNGVSQKLTASVENEEGIYYQIYGQESVVSLKANTAYDADFLSQLFSRESVAMK